MKESDEASKKRLDMLNEELSDKERQYSELEEEWKAEKASLSGTQTIKAELEQAKIAIEQLAVWVTWRGCLNCNTAKSRNWKSNWKPQRSSKAKLCVLLRNK